MHTRTYPHTHTYIYTSLHMQFQVHAQLHTQTYIYTYTCSFKFVLSFGAAAFDAAATPLLPSEKPAGAMLSFPRPKGIRFRRRLKLKIRIMRWILILLKIIFRTRRELNPGEFILEGEELNNVYNENGALMWRGRRLLQTGTAEVNKVQQASFDAVTQVS